MQSHKKHWSTLADILYRIVITITDNQKWYVIKLSVT